MKFYIGAGLNNYELVNNISERLKAMGWKHTYNWAENGSVENESIEDLKVISEIESNAINESDIIIILLPAGRGTHVELGMAIVLNKIIYLYSENDKIFNIENTAGFYYHLSVSRFYGEIDDFINNIKNNTKILVKNKD